MIDNNTHDPDDEPIKTDGGVPSRAIEAHRNTDYLDSEVNLLNPSTQFMQDHLRVVWTGFAAWALIVFGPVILTAIAPEAMSTPMPVIEFPLHYFLVAIGAPGSALVLSAWYARKRDQLDLKYGIDHRTVRESERNGEEAAATDGGVNK